MSAVESLLGACMSAGYAYPAALEEGVTEDDFERDLHRAVWRAMAQVYAGLGANEHIDPMLVATKMNGQLQDAGGVAYLHTLVTTVPIMSNARQYAREVMDASLKRKVRRLAQELQEVDTSGAQMLKHLQEQAFSLEKRPREAVTMTTALQDVWHEAEAPTKATCQYPWSDVQFGTRGLRPGWLTYLAAESSVGKTAAALEIADHNLGLGKTVLFLSLEMSAFELAVRIAQRHGFDPNRMYDAVGANDHDLTALSKLLGQPRWSRLLVETVDNVQQVGGIVRRTNPDLVILDYMQLLDIGRDTRLEGTTKNSRALKMMARKHSVPVIALSQLSRGGKEERGKLPGLWRLRDSGALEQDADAVVFVYRERGEDGEGLLPNGSFIVAKARMGRQGKVDFVFDGTTQRFTLMAREY